MTSDDYIFNALDIVRTNLLRDGSVVGLVWPYDDNEQLLEQNAALDFLISAGVLNVDTQDSIVSFENGDFAFKGTPTLDQQDNWKRTVTGFNNSAYEHLCEKYGLEPHALTYSATLKLIDDVIPIVYVGNASYTLPTLHSGKTSEIIRYCNRRTNQIVHKEELRNITSLHDLANIRNTLRNSVFAHNTGILRSFADATVDTITLHSQALLTLEQLHELRVIAND